jgi:protein-L-isoaspartate(D-aspartate) O-methyltransferase
MMDLAARRRFFAEEIAACCNLRTAALVDALAAVPRERFLRAGPWTFRGEGDFLGGPRQTPDADPKHLYHNVAVGIDPGHQLFNGAPSAVAPAIDALALKPGHRVLHIGCGLGYYSAIMAHIVGSSGRVVALEVDELLAADAQRNLSPLSWVEVQHGNGTEPLEAFDAILVNAGVTHPRDAWLDALVTGGRLVLPLTATMPQMGPIGKGPMLLIAKGADGSFDVRLVGVVAIYSAVGLRDDALNEALGKALMRGPFAPVKRLRRDPHEVTTSCWLHGPTFCLTT